MRALIPMLLCSALATPAAAESFDPYDPAALIAQARQAMREDEPRTACVLLSRAGQLAPHDARVEIAWGDYAARQQGMPIGEDAKLGPRLRGGDEVVNTAPGKGDPGRAPSGAQSPKPIPPEPPAPWPAR